MVRCLSDAEILSVFLKVEAYIVAVMLSLIAVMYIVSAIPVDMDVIRIAFLALMLISVLYVWYRMAVVIIRSGSD